MNVINTLIAVFGLKQVAMRFIFILTGLLVCSTVYGQENGPASEINYDFSSSGKIDVGQLDINSVL